MAMDDIALTELGPAESNIDFSKFHPELLAEWELEMNTIEGE